MTHKVFHRRLNKEKILAITNITEEALKFEINTGDIGLEAKQWKDVLSEESFLSKNGELSINTDPYGVLWLKTILR